MTTTRLIYLRIHYNDKLYNTVINFFYRVRKNFYAFVTSCISANQYDIKTNDVMMIGVK